MTLHSIKRNRRNSSSTQRWNDVPRWTMDEVSSHVRLDLQGRPQGCSTSSSDPMMEGALVPIP